MQSATEVASITLREDTAETTLVLETQGTEIASSMVEIAKQMIPSTIKITSVVSEGDYIIARLSGKVEDLMELAGPEGLMSQLPSTCTSAEGCVDYCIEHPEECEDLMQDLGLEGPGGCDSLDDCIDYCGENPAECEEFAQDLGLEGPGGCDSQETCLNYCLEHPAECEELVEDLGMEGPGGCTTEEECLAYCIVNPDECEEFVNLLDL